MGRFFGDSGTLLLRLGQFLAQFDLHLQLIDGCGCTSRERHPYLLRSRVELLGGIRTELFAAGLY